MLMWVNKIPFSLHAKSKKMYKAQAVSIGLSLIKELCILFKPVEKEYIAVRNRVKIPLSYMRKGENV